MSDSPQDLPPDLRDLEQELRARFVPPPGALFRARVLGAMKTRQASPAARWGFVAASAAAALLWMNLSLIGSAVTPLHGRSGGSAQEAPVAVLELRRLLPELSEAEARRQVWLLQARSRMVPAPRLQARASGSAVMNQGVEPWATH